MVNFAALMQTLAAVAPIDGISIGVENDRNTWRIDFKAEATQQQRDDAHAAMLAWVEPPPILSYDDWLALFTEAERLWAFDSARPATVRLAISLAKNTVDLSSPKVSAFLDLCISLGGLTIERKAQVLAGMPPT